MENLKNEIFVIFFILLNSSFIYSQSQQWKFANGPYEATLNSISFDPINPD